MKCRDIPGFVEACIEAYVDDELDDRDCAELEAHLQECKTCCQSVETQTRLKNVIRDRASGVRAPEELLVRISMCLDAADEKVHAAGETTGSSDARLAGVQRVEEHDGVSFPPNRHTFLGWRSMPVFASAAVLVTFVWMATGGLGNEPLVEDAVRKHVKKLPLEVTGPAESLQRWLRDKVDFNPEVLVFSSELEPLGARLSHVRDRPAVYVGYGSPGSGPDGERHASLFAFCDPSFDPSSERRGQRRVGDQDVVLKTKHGYNVVLWTRDGVVYSLVSNLDEREIFALIADAAERR